MPTEFNLGGAIDIDGAIIARIDANLGGTDWKAGLAAANLSGATLTLTKSDGATVAVDLSSLSDGTGGTDGNGIASSGYDAGTGILTLTFDDATTFSTGDLRGRDGVDAAQFAATIGDGATTSIAVAHNLGTTDVIVQTFKTSGGEEVIADVWRTDADTVTLVFGTAPTVDQYRVVISAAGV